MQQLTKEERIALRNKLFQEFNSLDIIMRKKDYYQINFKKLKNMQNDEKYNLYIQQFRTKEEALYCIINHDDFENHICLCGKLCKFYNRSKGYRGTCGDKECQKKLDNQTKLNRYNDSHFNNREKAKETLLREHGITHQFKLPKVVQKGKDTKERLYGNPNYNNREGAKQTCMDKYGEDNPAKLDWVKEAVRQTNLRNRGVDNPNKDPKVVQKRKDTKEKIYGDPNYNNGELAMVTTQQRYGSPYHMQNEEIKNNQRQTMMDRYGKPNPSQVKEFKEKSIKTYHENHDSKNKIIKEDIIKVINQIIDKKDNIDLHLDIYYIDDNFVQFVQKLYELKNNKKLTLNEIMNVFDRSRSTIKEKLKKNNLLDYFDIKDCELELLFEEFLKKNNIDFLARKFILESKNNTKQQLDFILKDYNISFEINDICSHNNTRKDQFYHINKTLQCKEKGIRLIHLWEWELSGEDLWCRTSNWILNLLNLNKTEINSKDCTIKQVPVEEEKEFFDNYDLYKYVKSNIALGLYYNNELLQCMSFRRQNDNQYEILRFCCKFGYEVKFGAKELINYFIQSYNPSSITITINFDKFIDDEFKELGFKLIQYNLPILISNDNNNANQSIYNCGQNVYILK